MSAGEKWREDFPIGWGEDNYVTRREFAKYVALVSGAATIGSGLFVLRMRGKEMPIHPAMEVAKPEDVPIGGVKLFNYPTHNDKAILVRLGADEYVAYAQRCTHLQCPVVFQSTEHRLYCPCHNGAFDVATGAVLQGPPPRPLPRIKLQIVEGYVTAVGMESVNHG